MGQAIEKESTSVTPVDSVFSLKKDRGRLSINLLADCHHWMKDNQITNESPTKIDPEPSRHIFLQT